MTIYRNAIKDEKLFENSKKILADDADGWYSLLKAEKEKFLEQLARASYLNSPLKGSIYTINPLTNATSRCAEYR